MGTRKGKYDQKRWIRGTQGVIILGFIIIGILISLKCVYGETYGVSLGSNEGIHTVSPEHDSPDEVTFLLEVTNDGDSQDTFGFEFMDDSSTTKYKKWMTLPSDITLDAGESNEIQFDILVNPYKEDNDAVADGKSKDIHLRVYSNGARDNNQEVENVTTDSYLAHVNIEEYQYASFPTIDPVKIVFEKSGTKDINISIENEGNGQEQYRFERDGKDGMGGLMDEYYFNISSITLDPEEIKQVHITVFNWDNPGEHDLYFHADSEDSYKTDLYFFTVEIKKRYEGRFSVGSSKTSDPGKTISMSVGVRNSGNIDTEFQIDDPILPNGWNFSWNNGNSKLIEADTAEGFFIDIEIPPSATAMAYQFNMTGRYQDEGRGYSIIEGSASFRVTVNELYRFEAISDKTTGDGDPGDTVMFSTSITNTGNMNDSYILLFEKPDGYRDASQWVSFNGLEDEAVISLSVNEETSIDILIIVPPFTSENDSAKAGLYGLKLVVQSQNNSGTTNEIVFEVTVNPFYDLDIWTEKDGEFGIFEDGGDLEFTFQIFVQNLGNTADKFLIRVPEEGFSGEWEKVTPILDGSEDVTIDLESLLEDTVTLTVLIKNTIESGNFTMTLEAKSLTDETELATVIVFLNVMHPPVAIIQSIAPDPGLFGEEIVFSGIGISSNFIERYVWISTMDQELYNGSQNMFMTSTLSAGTHMISMRVQDAYGIWSDFVNDTLIIHIKPLAIIESITPNPALDTDVVHFVMNGTDDGTIQRYVWRTNETELYNDVSPVFDYSDPTPGEYTVYLKVQDNDGAWSEEVSAHIVVLLDSDRDGVPDVNDAFPNNKNEWNDTDDDGIGDNSDAFKDDPAASKDSDGDGYPDEWNSGKTEDDSTTGLKRDHYPDDPKRWKKDDKDSGGFIPGFQLATFLAALGTIIIMKNRKD